MFITSDDITFGFDEWRRLRVSAPAEYRALAAWLYSDVQANLAAVDGFTEVLRNAERDGLVVNGNGCSVMFDGGRVMLSSRYGRWAPLSVPPELFWLVLKGLRDFLGGIQGDPGLVREDYPEVTRLAVLEEIGPGRRPVVVDHTYFPQDWPEEVASEAGTRAWQSDNALYDEETGCWSGFWRGLEIAGYYDPGSGTVLVYFPVLAP